MRVQAPLVKGKALRRHSTKHVQEEMIRKIYPLLGLSAGIMLLVSGCQLLGISDDAEEPLFEVTDDLSDRIYTQEQPQPRVDGKGSLFDLETVATIDAPEIEGRSTSATYLFADRKGQVEAVFVGYITAGDPFGGGIDVLDVTDPTDVSASKSLISADLDVGALAPRSKNHFYVAGAIDPDAGAVEGVPFSTPAAVAEVKVAGDKAEIDNVVDLSSGSATDVGYANGSVYAVTGEAGHFYRLRNQLAVGGSQELVDLRSVTVSDDNVFILDGAGQVYQGAIGGSSVDAFASAGEGISERSIAKIRYAEGRLYVALNTGGFVVLDAEDGSEVARREDGTYNALTARGSYVFAANTTGGVNVFEWTGDSDLEAVDTEKLDGFQANYIAAAGDYLYVANGEEGVRILKVTYPQPPA